jgi:hypothetical protein
MPQRNARLSRAQADDVAVICSWGSDALMQIAAAIEKSPPTIQKQKIRQTIATEIGGDKAEIVSRVLVSLAGALRRNFASPRELIDGLALPPDWTDAQRAKWRDCEGAIEKLLSIESVVLAAKATDLSYDVERFCVGARIVTDIRPVFDLERNGILGSTVRQTLRLEYATSDGTITSISIGLDADDIERIRKACEEATHKTSVATETLKKSGIQEIVIPGEDF